MYECFSCGMRTVIWGADFDFEDYGVDGNGIVHTLSCKNCGAEIIYFVPSNYDKGESDEDNNSEISST